MTEAAFFAGLTGRSDDLSRRKLWAAADPARRATKRQKDRLDLTRLAESHPSIMPLIPRGLSAEVDQLRTGP